MFGEWLPLLQIFGPIIGAIALTVTTWFLARSRNRAEVERLQGERKSVEAAAGLSTAEAASIISRAAADVVLPLTNRIRELQEDSKAMADRHRTEMYRMAQKHLELENHVAAITKENIDLKSKVASCEAKIALLSKPSELANETSRRLGEI